MDKDKFQGNLNTILSRIPYEREKLSLKQIVLVTKKRSADDINGLLDYLHHNQPPYFFNHDSAEKVIIGENFVQEYQKKSAYITRQHGRHFIGRLQESNVKKAVQLFDVIQSCHNKKILNSIQAAAIKSDKIQNVFLQVNISSDEGKAGFSSEEAAEILRSWHDSGYSHLKLQGLMTITRNYDNREDVRADFRAMCRLREDLMSEEKFRVQFENGFCHLSMGMSNDYDIAVEEGATIVRIGSAIWE